VAVLIRNPLITIDGLLADWTPAERIDNPSDAVAGYALYGTVQNDTYLIAIQATAATDPVIGAGSVIWLNTDQNTATGFTPFGSIGADYNVTFNAAGVPFLYTGTAGQTLVSTTALSFALSPDGKSLEIAIPRSLMTPVGAPAPASINLAAEITNPTAPAVTFLPADYTFPEYTITDPATLLATTSARKVAIVFSDTSAKLYFNQTAYSDLFMAAQNQARMAGVSYDVIDESQLTNIGNLVGYDALIFPAMPDVDTTQLPAILSTLKSAVYDYHIGIITAGDFLTNDQTGAALPGNPYASMATLLNLVRFTGGNSGNVTITANDVANPILQGYTAGQLIQSYPNEGYNAYQGVTAPADVLVNQNITAVDPLSGVAQTTVLPGVVQTTTGGTNIHFATTDLLGDSNLLSHAIQGVVLGTQPGVSLHTSRDAGIVAVRMDMDQSQFPADVSPVGIPGIYDKLIPILQQWKQEFNFVGTYFINIGDTPTAASPATTNWAVSLPYYKAILATGGEIGNHTYTHLTAPPSAAVTATTTAAALAGSTQITLDTLPSFVGITVGMIVTGLNIGANTPLPGSAGQGGGIANTVVTAVSGNTVTLSYVPLGLGTANDGVLGDIPAGTTLAFGVPTENTNFLQTGAGTVTGSSGDPFTYDYEFNQSKLIEQQQLGIAIYGTAIPGAAESIATDKNIIPYYPSVAPTATTPGSTGYITGGWTGIGSGYPGAIGYLSPTDQGTVYIAPNMTFDFTEIQFEGKTVAQAEADWTAQFNAITANAAGTPIVVLPVHDYGVAAWNTTNNTAVGSPYTTQMYTDFLAQAYAQNYEFVTLEDLASRTVAQQKATINYTTVGSAINATITPDPTAPDLGAMALSVTNGATQVIQNVTNWYAYNAQEVFLPTNGGSFVINLGTAQDLVSHIASLPMRDDLISVTGDGSNLSFSIVGSGDVIIDVAPLGNRREVITGATSVSNVGNVLDLALTGLGLHNVTLTLVGPPAEAVSTVSFSADTGSSGSDFITNAAAQTISGTLSAALAPGDVVKVSLDNGTTWLTAIAAAGATTFSLSGTILTGSNTLIARVEDITGLPNAALVTAYVLDLSVPTAPPAPDLIAASDSGVSNTDNVTDIATPTLTGTAEIGSLVTLFDGATAIQTTIATGGLWSVTAPTLTDGAHSFTATATDVAGNASQASDALSITIKPETVQVAANFVILDTTTQVATTAPGEAYIGPVAGLQQQYINVSSDSLNITAMVANTFIHSGSGMDAIDVSKVGGTNVLDGSTGSNFLVGGSGSDTYFVDDRGPKADIWSTVANFGTGDAVTIWGVTATDFHLAWLDGQGATGYTGLTLQATAATKPSAAMTLAGFTEADLGNGRLSVSFGDLGGGNTFMYIHANG
jgi:serralysin